MMPNRYAKRCCVCNVRVEAGEGFAYSENNQWFTLCNSTACLKKKGKLEAARNINARRLNPDGSIQMPYDAKALPLLRSLHGARWDGENKRWVASIEPKHLPRLIEVCDQLKLEVPDELRRAAEQGTPETRAAKERASTKGLYDYQREGVEFLALRDEALLADDMGLGKTVQALVAFSNDQRVLVICPAIVKYNWLNEIKKWRPGYRVEVLSGRGSFRVPEPGEIVIVNPDILPDDLIQKKVKVDDKDTYVDGLSKEIKQDLSQTILIVDEAHYYKNPKAKRSKKLSNLSRLCAKRWGLTGTPLDNKPPDLFGTLSSLNMNVFGFGKYGWNKFVGLMNGIPQPFGGYVWGDPEPEVPERLARVMLRRLKKDVLKDLPPKTHKRIVVDVMSKGLLAELNDIAVRMLNDQGVKVKAKELKGKSESEVFELVSQVNVPFKMPDFKEFSEMRAKLAMSRLPAALEIIESYEESDTPLVVFSAHQKPLEEIAERDGWEFIHGGTSPKRRQEIVDDFQNGKLKGVAVSIIAGGVGITLTRASNELFLDRGWTPMVNAQAEDRCHRIGQKDNVLVMNLVSNHPLDLHIDDLLERKRIIFEKAINENYEFKASENWQGEVALKEESDEELAARLNVMERAEKEADRAIAKERIHGILEREVARAKRPEPELTDERKELIRNALDYMVSRCDGAVEKDYAGFNKPDAAIGHWIARTGMADDDEVTFRVTERILSRYYRQLTEAGFQNIWAQKGSPAAK